MNRETKFRAHYQGKIYQVTELMWSNGTAYLWDGKAEDGIVLHLDSIHLLQFTGLKDKNGKEIYEGDILLYITQGTTRRGNPKATAGQKHYWEVFFSPKGQWCMRRGETSQAVYSASFGHEIIGNVFENPELLQ